MSGQHTLHNVLRMQKLQSTETTLTPSLQTAYIEQDSGWKLHATSVALILSS